MQGKNILPKSDAKLHGTYDKIHILSSPAKNTFTGNRHAALILFLKKPFIPGKTQIMKKDSGNRRNK